VYPQVSISGRKGYMQPTIQSAPPSAPLGSWGLLKEARESWDHFISDEIIYGSESCHSDLERTRGPADWHGVADWLAEYDLGRIWIELRMKAVGQRNAQFNAIVESALRNNRHRGRHPSGKTPGIKGKDHVLINDADFIENPQGMLLKCRPSVVRLKRFNDCGCCGKDVLHGITKSLSGIGRDAADGERSGATWKFGGLQMELCQLPSQLVQPGSQSISELPHKHPDSFDSGQCMDLVPEDVMKGLYIVIARDSVRLGIKEPLNPVFDFIDLRFRPFGFHLQIDNSACYSHSRQHIKNENPVAPKG